ncbi:tyrosine-type DNA invertase [Dryocola clanedunensis]
MEKRKHLTVFEINALLVAASESFYPERNYCLIYMCFLHGCRVSELNQIKLSDIDMGSASLSLRRLKNGLCTQQPLIASEMAVLRRWLEVRQRQPGANSPWLFLSRRGGMLSRQQIYEVMRECGERAGLSVAVHPHMLRHACGYAMAEKGIDTRLIQDYLGHRNIRHTVLYTASNMRRFQNIWQGEFPEEY